jgi:hypothetical protein
LVSKLVYYKCRQKTLTTTQKGGSMDSEVKRLMEEYGVSEEIAQSAWDACCDGEYLAKCGALSEVDDEIDPWDGEHEELRKEVESDAIQEAKNNQ